MLIAYCPNIDTFSKLLERPAIKNKNSLVSQHSVGHQIKIGRPKFYAGEMIMPVSELTTNKQE